MMSVPSEALVLLLLILINGALSWRNRPGFIPQGQAEGRGDGDTGRKALKLAEGAGGFLHHPDRHHAYRHLSGAYGGVTIARS